MWTLLTQTQSSAQPEKSQRLANPPPEYQLNWFTQGLKSNLREIHKMLHLKHFNKIKQFMIRLLRNNLYFRNITSNFADHSNQCYICQKSTDNIIHFLTCNVHEELLNNLRDKMRKIKLVSDFPTNPPFFLPKS